jgi:hypothetical protein
MAKTTGMSGQAKVCTTGGVVAEMLECTNWKINPKAEALDTTGMSSGGKKTFIPGLTEFDLSMSLKWEKTESKGVGATPVIQAGAVIDFKLFPDDALTNLHWDGSGVVTACPVDCPYEGLLTWEVTVQGSGTLTLPTANT